MWFDKEFQKFKRSVIPKSLSNVKREFRPNPVSVIRKDNGEFIIHEAELIEAWQEYFKELVNVKMEEEHRGSGLPSTWPNWGRICESN